MLAAALTAATLVAGHSAQDRPIVAVRRGDPAAPRTVLVVGEIHGNERAGRAVVRALRDMTPPAGVQVWTVTSANPDGAVRDTRQNARGVDLNRNFPHRWRGGGRPFDTYFPGRAARSEPETRAMQKLIRRLRPDVTLWYHQQLRMVVLTRGGDASLIRAYGRRTGLPAARLPHYRGTATSWQNATFRRATAFVVELPAGELSRAAARRHARAAMRTVPAATAATVPTAARPSIRWNPIPFGPERRRQMRAYSRRHYGEPEARLLEPRVIVQHYTASNSFASAWNTFASNARDSELGELPGVCAHFLIDRDGTIHQLVRLRYRCRHTVGLNHRSFGIEHVGTSDAAVMGNRPQLRASLRLTRWLQARHGIRRRHVIGHAESLSSPYHEERVRRLRTQTHGDMRRSTMRRYRRML